MKTIIISLLFVLCLTYSVSASAIVTSYGFVSNDGGATFTQTANASLDLDHALACSTTMTKCFLGTGMFGDEQQIQRSTDSGQTWVPVGPLRRWYGIACDSTCTYIVATTIGTDKELFVSNDSGITFSLILDNLTSDSWMNDVSSDGSKMSAYDGTYLYLSDDYGQSWLIKDLTPYAFQCVQANANFSTFVAVEGSWASKDGFKSTDLGDTWVDIWNESIVTEPGACDISPDSQTIMFGDVQDGDLWVSKNGGFNFSDVGQLYLGGNGNGNVKINNLNSSYACATASGSTSGVAWTVDGGLIWNNNSLVNGWQCYSGDIIYSYYNDNVTILYKQQAVATNPATDVGVYVYLLVVGIITGGMLLWFTYLHYFKKEG